MRAWTRLTLPQKLCLAYVAALAVGVLPGLLLADRELAARLGRPEQAELLAAARRQLFVWAGAGAAAGLLLALAAGRAIGGPLRELGRAARRIASGSSPERLPAGGPGEIAELARSLQRLSAARTRATEQLEAEKTELRAILEGMAEGVLLLDPADRILIANPAALQALPHGAGAIGLTALETTRSAELESLVRSAREGEAMARGEVRLGSGGRTYDTSVIPLAGAERGLVVVLHDITELKRLENVRREFMANISHELRTPLTAIRGFLETLSEDMKIDPEDRSRFLSAASRHALRLTNLVNELLDLARLDSPEFRIELRPCDLAGAVEHVRELYEGRARERSVTLATELEPDLPPVLADPDSLEQVLSNLVDNAIKYNREGGRVVVRASRSGELLRIAVEDTGVGIPPAHRPRIFERLYRVDPGRSREEGGTGLGLAIVKHVVMKLGGDIWVTSEPGRGSTFWFTLRLART